MKLLGLLALGAMPLGALGMSASLGVKQSLLADSKERSVSFAALPFDLSSNTLMAMHPAHNDFYKELSGLEGHIGCTESGTIQNNGEIAVVLAFSKCLNDTALGIIDQWVEQVKSTISTIVDMADLEVTFQSTMVPGACEERSEKNKQGIEDPVMENQGGTSPPEDTAAPMLLASEVLPSDLKRLEAFPSLGQVVDLADDGVNLAVDPIAVISFITGETSFSEVIGFEASAHVSKTFNFQICQSGINCEGSFENCIKLEEVVDLFMYNPFTVTRSLECANLDDGVPVTFLDESGARQCFCDCPAGYEMEENEFGHPACKKVTEETCPCVWATCHGFKHEVTTDEAVCLFKDVGTNWGLPVPFPTDGYVSDKRDTLTKGFMDPRITVLAQREQDNEYNGADIRSVVGEGVSLPLTFARVLNLGPSASGFTPIVGAESDTTTHSETTTWKDYQMNRDAHIDDMEFTSYGKYHLEVSAYDYFSKATCAGCLVIVDHNRPTATTPCPESFCDDIADPIRCTDSAELTEANLEKANGLASQYFDYADKATNDACSIDNRCDSKSLKRRDFFEPRFQTHASNKAAECFDKEKVIADLLDSDRTKTNPLVDDASSCDNTDDPVPAGQCTRCCKMETALKEWWTDYRCGSDYDARSCEGDADQVCTFKQCLVMNGDTLATVSAAVTDAAKTESESVLSKVENEAYQTVTQIHRALDCTSFGGTDGECDFRAKLSELIDTTEGLNFATASSSPVATDYVFWRYRVAADSWQLWKTAKNTEYGEITYEDDDVLTFSSPETKITLEAWTQCGLVRRFFFYVHLHVHSPMSVCDKFDKMWYQTSVSRLPIQTGMCAYPGSDFAELTFDFHPNAGLQYSREELRMKVSKVECTGKLGNRNLAPILTVTEDSPEIVTRFAVTMLNKATTEAATDFHVSCVFTYAQHSGNVHTATCKHDFSISDCKGPAFDPPNGECEFDACAGDAEAGLYEACGGTIISADETCTIVTTGEKPCCQGCESTEVTCTALLDLPNADADIMRCEPSSDGAYSTYATVLLTETAQEHPAATALLASTALIAVVALVVVRRRVVASHSAQTADDAYYPLLY